jgi:hypothetical protein
LVQTVQGSKPALAVFDTSTGKAERYVPEAVVPKSGRLVFSASQSGSTTTVQAVDITTGTVSVKEVLSGRYTIPEPGVTEAPAGLSSNGRWLVLEGSQAGSGQAPPSHSEFAVLDTSFRSAAKLIELEGSLRFDAIDDNGEYLYLIDYLPESQGRRYDVRRYDLATKTLTKVSTVDKLTPVNTMGGTRLQGVYAQDGSYHFGVYMRQANVAFVHALPLSQDAIAFCIDLPGTAGDDAQQLGWALATGPKHSLYAVNPVLHEIVEIGLNAVHGQPGVVKTGRIPEALASWPQPWIDAEAKELHGLGAAVSGDGSTLYALGPGGVLVIDAASLRVRHVWANEITFTNLVLSPDGKTIFATTHDMDLVAIDAGSGRRLGSWHTRMTVLGLVRALSA